MNAIKIILNKILNIPLWITVVIAIPSFILTALFLMRDDIPALPEYSIYALSSYALVLCIKNLIHGIKWLSVHYQEITLIQFFTGIPFVNRYLSDLHFRQKIGLYIGFLSNLIFITIKFFVGVATDSIWLKSVAGYYLALALIRIPLIHHMRDHSDSRNAWKRSMLSGIFLLTMNFALTALLVLMVGNNERFEYPGVMIYAMAVYAFSMMAFTLYQFIKFRNFKDPVISAMKTVSLTAAMVSMLSLETAMFSAFASEETLLFQQRMLASSGLVICITITYMAIRLILRSVKHLRSEEA